MVRLGRVPGCGPDAAVPLGDQVRVRELVLDAAEGSSFGVQLFCESLGEAICQRLHHDRAVVVVRFFVAAYEFLDTVTNCHGKEPDVVVHAAVRGRHEVAQAPVHAALALALLPQTRKASPAVRRRRRTR